MKFKNWFLVPTSLVLIFAGKAAIAQDEPNDVLGIRAGAFIFYPLIETSFGYNDNVFSTENNKAGDFIFKIQPRLSASTDAERYQIDIDTGANIRLHAKLTSEDQANGDFSVRGRYDILRQTSIDVGFDFDAAHESRGSSDSPQAVSRPIPFRLYGVDAGLTQGFNRFSIRLAGLFLYSDFDDVDRIAGGLIDQDFRDRILAQASLRPSYEFSPGYRVFVEGSYNYRDRNDNSVANVPSRDSQGFGVNGGLEFELTRLISGEVYGGYLYQNFDDPRLRNVKTYNVGAGINWTPLESLKIGLDVRRGLSESTIDNTSARINTSVLVRIDYDMWRNLKLSPRFLYRNENFNGTLREDHIYTAGVDLRYDFNRNFYARLGYSYHDRDSNGTVGVEYRRNEVFLAVGMAF